MLSGGGPSLWTVGRSVGVSLVPPPLAAGQFWTKACKPLTPAHICTHTCTHTHTRRDECTGAHARSHGIWGDNGFRAPLADACQSWGPRQTAGPPPRWAETPPSCCPAKYPHVSAPQQVLSLIRSRAVGARGEGEAAPVPSPPAPPCTSQRPAWGLQGRAGGPSGSLLGRELNTKRQLPAGRVGGQWPL